jgi:molybdopterin/thiamine biosynthesis adenylyltransferase
MELALTKKGNIAVDHTRHLAVYHVPTHFSVGIIGAGGIGATSALVLAKMGVIQLTVWDDDLVGEVNIATQLHKWSEIEQPKVFSLQRTLEEFSDEILFTPMQERITETSAFPHFNLLISAVDSITARKLIWDAIYRGEKPRWYLDARMSAEEFQMFVLDMSNKRAIHSYATMLESISEDDIPEVPCTEKATFHCSAAAAMNIGATLRNILRNEQASERVVHYIPQFVIHRFAI